MTIKLFPTLETLSPAAVNSSTQKTCYPSLPPRPTYKPFLETQEISPEEAVILVSILSSSGAPRKAGLEVPCLSLHKGPLKSHPPTTRIPTPSHITLGLAIDQMFKAYKNLTPKTRLGFGVAVLAWGGAGLYFSDRAEEKYQPTPEEKAVVDKYVPKVTVVDRSE
ncbi:hypothetical protein Landi51_10039 [Colletotrichum acutatum]